MRIAVPIAGGLFCQHFGGAESFALFTADEEARSITGREDVCPPTHERGVFPAWLRDQGVKTVLAGGMGGRATAMLSAYGVEVVMGLSGNDPHELVGAYLEGRLASSGEPCGGGGYHDCGHHEHGG
jgi:predicted Fe-Mo cluster-binding NifX family protein